MLEGVSDQKLEMQKGSNEDQRFKFEFCKFHLLIFLASTLFVFSFVLQTVAQPLAESASVAFSVPY